MDDMRNEVKEGYEQGDYEGEYRQDRELRDEEKQLLDKLFSELDPGAEILDLGCGTGLPFDRYLAEKGYNVTGVDIAENHVEAARQNVPDAEFLQGDFFEQEFGENSFDAVVSFYAIFHIPRDEHRELYERINYWLKDAGYMLATVAGGEMEEYRDEDFVGSEMVWSSHSQEKNRELIEDSGFSITETYEEKDDEHHLWILAENTA